MRLRNFSTKRWQLFLNLIFFYNSRSILMPEFIYKRYFKIIILSLMILPFVAIL